MDSTEDMRKIVGKQAFISAMASVTTDIKNLALSGMPLYVIVATGLALLVLFLSMHSFVTPFIFLIGIGIAIIYNIGSNVIFWEISYITQPLPTILQLGVTMDYSIFRKMEYQN